MMIFWNIKISFCKVKGKLVAFLGLLILTYIAFLGVYNILLKPKCPFPVPPTRNDLSHTPQTDYPMFKVTGMPDCLSGEFMAEKGSANGQLKDDVNLCDTFNGRLKKSNCQYYHPNVVYFIKFSNTPEENEIVFRDYVSIVSVHKFYKPSKIVILCNQPLTGEYWQKALDLGTPIELRHIDRIKTIGNKNPKAPGFITHEADYIKVVTAFAEGGVYMDFDVIILNGEKLREMQRKSEIVLGRDDKDCIRTCAGFFSSVPQSPFVGGWLNMYNTDYLPSEWVYNAGDVPSNLLRTCSHHYDVVVDTHMSNWQEAENGIWLQPGEMNWKEKAVVHYMNSLYMQPLNMTELHNVDSPLIDMFKYVLGEEHYEFL